MSKRYSLEREKTIDEILKKRLSPISAGELAEELGVDSRTIQRDIRNLRDFYFMPVLSSKGEGYYYDNAGKNKAFPAVTQKLSEEEIKSLVMAYRLSATIPHQELKKNIRQIFDKISHFVDFDLLQLENKISLKNVRYYQVAPDIFAAVMDALRRSRKAEIVYRANNKDEATGRTIQPLHLIIYMGNWHLLAWCETKGDVRIFTLCRIQQIKVSDEKINRPLETRKIKDLVYRSYGIFLGENRITVRLRFSPQVYGIVKDQIWSFEQQMEENDHGEVTLTLQVSDFTEIKRDILSFGRHVEVLDPPELRDLIQQEIQQMNKIY